MIGNLPLWLLVFIWWLQRRHTPRLNTANYPRILRFLDDLYAMIPVPRTQFEWWLVKQVTNWVDREKENLYVMRSIGVVATGTVENKPVIRTSQTKGKKQNGKPSSYE